MKKIVVVVMLVLGACTNTNMSTPAPTHTPTSDSEQVEFHFDDVVIELQQLSGWDVYVKTDDRLIMTEGEDPFKTSGGLNGLLVNIWVPTLNNLDVKYDPDNHSIADVLKLVLRMVDKHGEYAVFEPIPFDWDDHDAAYYTITNKDGNLSLVIAIKVSHSHFIAVNISAPSGHSENIRNTLPMIFDPFVINGKHLDNSALEDLPSPLEFPDLHPVSETGD